MLYQGLWGKRNPTGMMRWSPSTPPPIPALNGWGQGFQRACKDHPALGVGLMEIVGTPEDTEEESGVPDKAVGKTTLLSTDILKTNY